ncbi:MAG: CRISPR-associated helicase Cas3' [Polyangiaceae bacterium]|nr:CRISPR-associated helicase Cas3' [Polyangiaceae bacterium]
MPGELLAKSPRGPLRLSLRQHLEDTEHAATRVFDLDRRWGRSFCRFFKIGGPDRKRFLLHLRIAALFHDIGKANEDFYQAVTTPGATLQALRHEHLSALILHLPEVRGWLAKNPSLDLEVITAAVLSHHLKASPGGDHKWCAPRGKTTVRLYLGHAEVRDVLRRIADIAGLPASPALPQGGWAVGAPPWEPAWRAGLDAADLFGRAIRKTEDRRRLLLATKAGLIVADSVASGLVREGHPIDRWINDVVHSAPIGPDEIEASILAPRAQQIARAGRAFEYHQFQLRAAEQGSRALLLAACGAGKTLAAWKWAEAQVRAAEIGKVVFLYPTRGTATEGFRDYVAWAPEADAALLHGTSQYELEAMRDNPSEGGAGKRFGPTEGQARLFALGHWSKRFFSATVDQFLSFMEHGYASLCLLPLLADAAVIIDEVHSFDKHMFRALLAFLKQFDVPVLCMTATLPPSRRDELAAANLRVYPTNEERDELADLDAKERVLRYRLEALASAAEAEAEAITAYRAGGRVLWVVNQVARCQAIARRLRAELGPEVRCYHSRFRLEDRQRTHRATVEAFQQKERPAIAITTQVCEMSLDLDADLLITELAPVTSLIQRFGRAHRRLDRPEGFRARLLTYAPESLLPYTRDDLDAAQRFIDELRGRDLGQRDLAEALDRHAPEEAKLHPSTRFLESGYYATPGALRDTDDFATSCVLDADLPEAMRRWDARAPIDGLILSVPRRATLGDDARPPPPWPKYLGVAPADRYDADLGFCTDEGDRS